LDPLPLTLLTPHFSLYSRSGVCRRTMLPGTLPPRVPKCAPFRASVPVAIRGNRDLFPRFLSFTHPFTYRTPPSENNPPDCNIFRRRHSSRDPPLHWRDNVHKANPDRHETLQGNVTASGYICRFSSHGSLPLPFQNSYRLFFMKSVPRLK